MLRANGRRKEAPQRYVVMLKTYKKQHKEQQDPPDDDVHLKAIVADCLGVLYPAVGFGGQFLSPSL